MKKAIKNVLLILLIVFEIIGFVIALSRHGLIIFGLYTQDSNLIMLIATIIYFVFTNSKREGKCRKFAKTFFYVGTCLVTVTITVVLTILMPMGQLMEGMETAIDILIDGSSLYHHLLCPVLAIIIFLVFEDKISLELKENLIALIPTIIYAVVTTTLNVLKVIKGPYPFLYVYEQPVWLSVVWFIVIPTGAYLIAYILRKIKCKVQM